MHGSLNRVSINGVDFIPPADVDVNLMIDEWENTAEPNSSGPTSIKSVRKVPQAQNLTLRVDSTELGFLRAWAEAGSPVEFIMALRDGSEWGCLGTLMLGEYSSANGTIPITMQCSTKWDIAAA